jgi:hypothetical protein
MPLKPCRECGTKVSIEARICPKCGVGSPAMNKGKSHLKALIWGIIAIVLGVNFPSIITGSNNANLGPIKTQAPTNEAPPEILKTTAASLFQAYESNEVLADNTMRGKVVEVTGKIQSIDKNTFGTIILSMETGSTFNTVRITVDDAQTQIAEILHKGSEITANCKDMKRIFRAPFGTDCKIIAYK